MSKLKKIFFLFLAFLFALPRFINFSIHATNGSAGKYSINANFSNPHDSNTAFAASRPVRQARSKKKAGAGCRTQSPAQNRLCHGVTVPR